jgi:large subunit ribosomal protein L25
MDEITIDAEARPRTGHGTRALRREGKVPGIFYIRGEENIPFAVTGKSLQPLIYTTESHIVNLKFADGSRKCILRDVQFDPVTDLPIHVDLQGLRENEEITLEVPVTITGGIPQGVRDGGVLQQSIRGLRISCLPKHIPNHIEVNAEGLKMNQFVHVRDIVIPNVTILANEDDTILGVIPPTVEKEPTPEAAVEGAAAEPEVIAKGKKPEEGAEAAAGAEGKAEATAKGKAETPAKGKGEAPAKEEKKK